MSVDLSRNMDTVSANYQDMMEKARRDLKKIENRGVSRAETLEDIRETKGKSFRTADLEKLMEKYDPEAYAKYSKFAKSADGARSHSGLTFLSNWMDKVKKGLNDGTILSDGTKNISSETTKRTAADELAYLSKKYSNYSFLAANYSMGMRYGSNATVNVAISPQFLVKMANDPELEKEYEKQIAGMQECDEHFRQMQAARGWRVDAQGWAIDKDGGISSWTIVTKDPNAKSHLQTMSENAEKIRKQKKEVKEEKLKIEKKHQADREEKKKLQEKMAEAGKEKFENKWKGITMIDKEKEAEDKTAKLSKKEGKDKVGAAGINLDMKI